MNILYHHRTRCTGADGTHIRGVAKGFEKLGHQLEIVSPRIWSGSNMKEKAKVKTQGKTYYLKIPRVLFEVLEILYNIPAFFRLFVLCATKRFDVLYERYAFLNLSGFLVSCMFKKPLFLEVNFTTRTQVHPKRTKVFSKLERYVENIVFQHATVIIVISDKLKNDISEHGINGEKILVLPNAVDIEQFQPTNVHKNIRFQYGINNGDKLIGFVGSFYPWHGLDFLIDSFKLVLEEYKTVNLMLIGDGQMCEGLKRRIAKEHLQERVIFTGSVDHESLADYIAIFDIGIMPDSNNYGSPMKIFEYMAIGKPIVAPRLKPIEAVINDEQEGFLFTQRKREELKRALITLLNDTELCKKMGKAGREKVCREHTWKKNVSKIIILYKRLQKDSKRERKTNEANS